MNALRKIGWEIGWRILFGIIVVVVAAVFAIAVSVAEASDEETGIVVENATTNLILTVFADGRAVGVEVPPGRKAFVPFRPGATEVEVKVISKTRAGDPVGMKTKIFALPEAWPVDAIDL